MLSGALRTVLVPGAPQNVAVASPTSGTVLVTWGPPIADGGAAVTAYKITAVRVSDSNTVITTIGLTDTHLVQGLTPGVAYNVTVRAVNSAGDGAQSAPINLTLSNSSSYTLESGVAIPAGWPSPATTGLWGTGRNYGALTPSGSITTTSNGQIIELLDIQGNVTVRHLNVTIRHCRIESIQTSVTLTGGEAVVDGNQSTVDGFGTRTWLSDNLTVHDCEVIGSLDPNLNDQTGIGVGGATGMTAQRNWLHDLADSLLPADNGVVTDNLVCDVKVASGAHADCVQVTDGDNILIEDNSLICLTRTGGPVLGLDGVTRIDKVDSFGNAAVQIGAQTGPLTNLNINHNYMSGGGYTINVNRSSEVTHGNITGAYTGNVFSGYWHYGPNAGIGSGMTFDNSNVWETTRVTNNWQGAGETVERYWHLTGGAQINGVTNSPTP